MHKEYEKRATQTTQNYSAIFNFQPISYIYILCHSFNVLRNAICLPCSSCTQSELVLILCSLQPSPHICTYLSTTTLPSLLLLYIFSLHVCTHIFHKNATTHYTISYLVQPVPKHYYAPSIYFVVFSAALFFLFLFYFC